MDVTSYQSGTNFVEEAALPSRGERLRAFVALKGQRRSLVMGVIALVLVCVTLLVIILRMGAEREVVPLGRGIAGVDTVPAGTGPTFAADAGPEIVGGEASYYGDELTGSPTASGEAFDPEEMTAAHRTLPMGSKLKVTNARTGDSVVVRVNDRGPFHGRRVIDVSKAAAQKIGLLKSGTGRVELALLD